MNFSCNAGSIWVGASGGESELRQLRDKLAAVSQNANGGRAYFPLCYVEAGSTYVLRGCVADRFPPVQDADARRVDVKKLEAAGLLRDYQAEACIAVLTAQGEMGILNVAMGGGKTRIAAAIMCVVGGRWLYLVSNQELVAQAQREFAELTPKMMAVLSCDAPDATSVTYAGIGKLADKHFHGVIVDECHGLPAPTRCLPYALVKAEMRVGLSGTALDRQDAKNALTIGLLGPVVYTIDVARLESEGHLARGQVLALVYDHNKCRLVFENEP